MQPRPQGKANAALCQADRAARFSPLRTSRAEFPASLSMSRVDPAERSGGEDMRKLAIAAVFAAQMMAAAQPAPAAELPRDLPNGATRIGTFAGARLRVPLGSAREKAHAGLAFTATQRSGDTGILHFSKGMELGFAGDDKVRLSVGGRPFSQLAAGGSGPGGRRLGVSGLGWTAIGVGVVALAVGGLYIWVVDHHCDNCD
jgi:hypothetical protein